MLATWAYIHANVRVRPMNAHLLATAPPAPDGTAGQTDGGRDLISFRVGDLARISGKTVRALHLYEELGLLIPNSRSKGGYRLYDADALVRLRWMNKLQDMGFSLPEIQQVLREWHDAANATTAMERVRSIYAAKLAETRSQMERLRQLEKDLEESLAYLGTCGVCPPVREIKQCPACDLHDCSQPDLIRGLHAH